MTETSTSVDRDSLHILPLSILPLETPSLRRARMIKNAKLDSVVEMFNSVSSGSGQLRVDDLAGEFDWDEEAGHPDLVMLRRLSRLPSYDVYSLRISLRELDISIDDHEALQLSPEISAELAPYMTDFTRPLIAQIYGQDDLEIQSFADIVGLFRDPDVGRALSRLKTMAEKLGISPEDVPTFIEDYGDIFLSLSYYRKCLDSIEPIVAEFNESMADIKGNYSLREDQNLMKTVDMMQTTIMERMVGTAGLIENFERSTKHMWDDISAERFKRLREMITSYHTTIGGVLCALAVKMAAWERLFPSRHIGSPAKRSEFIMVHLRHGMDRMRAMNEDAPMPSALD